MKRSFCVCILLSICCTVSAQDYQRKIFDYVALGDKDTTQCSDHVFDESDKILGTIENLKSAKAVADAKALFDSEKKCPGLFEVYAWALFRNGEWMKACNLIDSAIGIYGASSPDLIMRRGYMNIEMAELGVGVQNIDGNSVYQSKSKQLQFEETNFKKQNYLAALSDLSYIADSYEGRAQEIYLSGYIYQQMEEYDKSNDYLTRLLAIEQYSDKVILMIVDNIIGQKKYSEAEQSLANLERKFPRSSAIQKKYAELYEKEGDKEKHKLALKKQSFYDWVPEYCDMIYSEENYQTVSYFLGDDSAKKKIKKFKEIKKTHPELYADVLLTVLNTHSNHGNGVEAEARKMLTGIGEPVVPKVIMLMENAPSTCTVTDAAAILADLKDPRGWQPMIDYLPRMENLPLTMIPPSVPAQIIRFDKVKALPALLSWIRPQIIAEEEPSGNPLDQLPGIFAATSTYGPMKVYAKEEVKKVAGELLYTDKQIEKLLEKIYGK